MIHQGKRLYQFGLLAEMGLDHGDRVSLSAYGCQPLEGSLRASVHLMRLDSMKGEWTPADFGQDDKRTFPRYARVELIRGPSHTAMSGSDREFEVTLRDVEIIGAFTESPDRSTDDPSVIGIEVEFANVSRQDEWLYSPCLCKGSHALNCLPQARTLPGYYRGIPRTIQRLWRGEPLHIIVMGSSIDRGSANPPLYLYDENPASSSFKQPLASDMFEGEKVGHPEWNHYIGWWQHYFMYGGRLRVALMQKFNYPIQKILLNTMACDGSSISEAHSGVTEYASLSCPPDPGINGHRSGKTWMELYPDVFARRQGPQPDLVIFGSGANEKVDGADEIAIFEGAIRWFQRHYPRVEFLFCMFHHRDGYTPNTGHLMELALRYQIPFIDLGRILSQTTRHCNSYALVPRDGHPQAAAHYLWCKQLERAFDVTDPIEQGLTQRHLPDRVSPYTIGWEADMRTYTSPHPRIHEGTAFILDDTVVNLWATCKDEKVGIRIDGAEYRSGSRLLPMQHRDGRNSTFATGRLSLGDRHIVEVTGTQSRIMAVDAKTALKRQFVGASSPQWNLHGLQPKPFASQWGSPFGCTQLPMPTGKSAEVELPGTDFSVAYVDQPPGGTMSISVDGSERLVQPTNVAFKDARGRQLYLENRKCIVTGIAYGTHSIRIQAVNSSILLLGIFSYDTRATRDNERVLRGWRALVRQVSSLHPSRRGLMSCVREV